MRRTKVGVAYMVVSVGRVPKSGVVRPVFIFALGIPNGGVGSEKSPLPLQ